MPARMLLVGDVHLGRRPAHLPDDLDEFDVRGAELTPRAAWEATVGLALSERVQAVVLAGDVVESDNDRFEAFGPLHRGVARLVEAGIGVWAVAGNHDTRALPRLAELIPGFRLLGADGRWEIVTLDSRPPVRLAGWSFPAARVPASPLRTLPAAAAEEGPPLFGVLHCDLQASRSNYAPVPRTDLERTPMRGWFLGHVHGPSDLDPDRPIGYLGSLVGLDVADTGDRGPWLCELDDDGRLRLEHVTLAPLRWEDLRIDVGTLGSPERLVAAITRAIETLHERLSAHGVAPRAVGCRLLLEGRSGFHRELLRSIERDPPQRLRLPLDGVLYFVADVADASRPDLDLIRLARDDHPAALLARRLLDLERGGPHAEEMLRRARAELERVAADARWVQLEPARLDERDVRRLLLEAGTRALEELLAQTETPAEHAESA